MQQHFILRHLRRPSRHGHQLCHHFHTFIEATAASSINWVRDRALDHAVEKERDLNPTINIKNLINSEPSKSLPISIISDKRSKLGIPTRPIDFIRKYPSVFQEFLPGGIGIHPHIKLTPEILNLDAEEQLLFDNEIQKQDVANRLLKLLMLARINKIPVCVIDRLKWDLGLPDDYVQSVVPQFPDYFQVTSSGDELELVCWSDELAVSVMQKNSMTSFPIQYSRGFEVDKKFKKWVDNWQKLPYISPYENASNLQAKSDESDKWTVGLLHEVLHILVPKKTEKDNLLFLGEYLGIRSRFKRALLQHPGIFYVSSKLNTHTVVLREAYKRDLLVSNPPHPLMNLRSNYIHLMRNKSKNVQVIEVKKQKATQDPNEREDDEWSEQEEDDSETEAVTDSDCNNDHVERDNLVINGRTPTKKTSFEGKNILVQRGRKHTTNNDDYGEGEDCENGNSKMRRRTSRTEKFYDSPRRNTPNSRSSENDGRRRGREKTKKSLFDEKIDSRTNLTSHRYSEAEAIIDSDCNNDHVERDNLVVNGRTPTKKTSFEGKNISVQRGRKHTTNKDDYAEGDGCENGNSKIRRRTSRTEKFYDSPRRNTPNSRSSENDGRRRGREKTKSLFDEKTDSRTNQMSHRKSTKIF